MAGAWLLISGVRERIGYRGLRSDKAGLDEAIEDLDGLLDPVIDRAAQCRPAGSADPSVVLTQEPA